MSQTKAQLLDGSVVSVAFSAGTAGAPSLTFTSDPNTGIYSPGADQVAISTNGTERARIDSSGRLLVGTSTARGNFFNTTGQETVFQIEGTTNQTARASIVRNSNDDAAALLIIGKTRSASVGGNTIVAANDFLGGISFQGADGSELVQGVFIYAEVDGTPGANDMPGRLVFSTTADGASSPTERMRIGSNGSVQIGAGSQLATEIFRVTSGNSWAAAIEANRNVSGDRNLYLTLGTNCNNTSSYFIDCTTATVGPKFYVYGNGTYGTVSDATLKKNIETARDGYLDDIQKLRVVKYNWKTDDDGTPKELGWIAQELAEVFPGLVQDSQPDADGNTVKEVKTSVLQFMLLKALQEANTKIKTLEGRLTAAGL